LTHHPGIGVDGGRRQRAASVGRNRRRCGQHPSRMKRRQRRTLDGAGSAAAVSALGVPGDASRGVVRRAELDCAGIARWRRQSARQRQCQTPRTIGRRPMRVSPRCTRSPPSSVGCSAR
jgi:hypothetical protein